jgi:hypothetical protein
MAEEKNNDNKNISTEKEIGDIHPVEFPDQPSFLWQVGQGLKPCVKCLQMKTGCIATPVGVDLNNQDMAEAGSKDNGEHYAYQNIEGRKPKPSKIPLAWVCKYC